MKKRGVGGGGEAIREARKRGGEGRRKKGVRSWGKGEGGGGVGEREMRGKEGGGEGCGEAR